MAASRLHGGGENGCMPPCPAKEPHGGVDPDARLRGLWFERLRCVKEGHANANRGRLRRSMQAHAGLENRLKQWRQLGDPVT